MKYLELNEVLHLHNNVILKSGGLNGVRDMGGLESAVALPQMTMFGDELYPTFVEKAAILGFSLISNHPFLDGNKRIGHAAMETFMLLNGYEIDTSISVDEQEAVILKVATGEMDKETVVIQTC